MLKINWMPITLRWVYPIKCPKNHQYITLCQLQLFQNVTFQKLGIWPFINVHSKWQMSRRFHNLYFWMTKISIKVLPHVTLRTDFCGQANTCHSVSLDNDTNFGILLEIGQSINFNQVHRFWSSLTNFGQVHRF